MKRGMMIKQLKVWNMTRTMNRRIRKAFGVEGKPSREERQRLRRFNIICKMSSKLTRKWIEAFGKNLPVCGTVRVHQDALPSSKDFMIICDWNWITGLQVGTLRGKDNMIGDELIQTFTDTGQKKVLGKIISVSETNGEGIVEIEIGR